MKSIRNSLLLALLLGVIFIAVMNTHQTINLLIWGFKGAEAIGMLELTKTINLAAYTFIITFVGVLAGAGFVGQFYFAQKEKLNAYKRELEKNSVTNYANTSKVEILEAKIATLEKALSEKLDQ